MDKYNRVIPDPETLVIPVFKNMWDKDTSEDKEMSLKKFAYLYFKYNPKSDYLKHSVGEELDKLLKKDLFNDENYALDIDIIKAESYYSNILETLNLKALKSAQGALDKISKEFDSLDLSAISDMKERTDIMAKTLSIITKIDEATLKLSSAMKKIQEEQLSNNRGKKELSRFEKPRSKR